MSHTVATPRASRTPDSDPALRGAIRILTPAGERRDDPEYGTFVADSVAQNLVTSMWSGDNVPSVGNTFGNPSYAGVFHTTYLIKPNLLNEVSFNYNGNRIHILPAGLISAPAGFTFAPFFPHTGDGKNVDTRIPSIQLNGSTGSNYTVNWMPC